TLRSASGCCRRCLTMADPTSHRTRPGRRRRTPTRSKPRGRCRRRRIARSNLDGLVSPDAVTPYAHQASAGALWRLGASATIEADYSYAADRSVWNFRNINIAYDPATGANYPSTNIARRPYPDWGTVSSEARRPENRARAARGKWHGGNL